MGAEPAPPVWASVRGRPATTSMGIIRPRRRRHNTRWLRLRPPDQLDDHERVALEQLLADDPEVACGYALLQRFRRVVAEHDVLSLHQWLHDARASQLPPFARLANGIQADRAAVEAALTPALEQRSHRGP